MLTGLLRYARNFSVSLLFKRERNIVLRDFFRYSLGQRVINNQTINPWSDKTYNETERSEALTKTINWLLHSQASMSDGGFGSYRIITGWTTSYPETSGYIIPTLLRYAEQVQKNEILTNAIRCGDWLITIQKQSGGWQGEYMADNRAEVVFNTGQIIRGMVGLYKQTNDKKYLDSAVKACDWLCSIQEDDGCWKKSAFMGVPRVYDSYVDAPLLQVYEITKNELYKQKAVNNLNWVIDKKQLENGWFEDCDNTIKHNNKPILHTIAYTIDGLLESGLLLNDKKVLDAAIKSADKLFELFSKHKYLSGRFDRNWKGSQDIICTGCAQISIIWLKLYKLTKNIQYLNAAMKMNDQLIFIQDRQVSESADTKGAMPGSYPLWGRYEAFNFPNWATKYFADSLLLEKECLQEAITLSGAK
ncbi:MAG TPA: beta-L-arabinofuranosidase domain-containing protein [Bacteroidia bacterium]|nr:beta-L-arabinofuranosidase domain-containing protein [Bacteroidia bacterium]